MVVWQLPVRPIAGSLKIVVLSVALALAAKAPGQQPFAPTADYFATELKLQLESESDPLIKTQILSDLSNLYREWGEWQKAETWALALQTAIEALPAELQDLSPTGVEELVKSLKQINALPFAEQDSIRRSLLAIGEAAGRRDLETAIKRSELLLKSYAKLGAQDVTYGDALVSHASLAADAKLTRITRAALELALPIITTCYGTKSEPWRVTVTSLLDTYDFMEETSSPPPELLEQAAAGFAGRTDFADMHCRVLLSLAKSSHSMGDKDRAYQKLDEIDAILRDSEWILSPMDRLTYGASLAVAEFELGRSDKGRLLLSSVEATLLKIPADQWTNEIFAICATATLLKTHADEIDDARRLSDLSERMLHAAGRRLQTAEFDSGVVEVGPGLTGVSGITNVEAGLSILQGVCDFNVGHWDRAESHFRAALALQDSAASAAADGKPKERTSNLQVRFFANHMLALLRQRDPANAPEPTVDAELARDAQALLRRVVLASDPESTQLSNSQALRAPLDVSLSASTSAPADAYQAVLDWKGLAGRIKRTRQIGKQTEKVRKAAENVRRLESAIGAARLRHEAPSYDDVVALNSAMEQLSDLAENASTHILLPNVMAALPDGAVLLDFISHYANDVPASVNTGAEMIEADRLLMTVFVVTRERVNRIELGDATTIDATIRNWSAALNLRDSPDVDRGDDLDEEGAQAQLEKSLWKPIENAIAGRSNVIVCPDGPICKVPFGAISADGGRTYLIEKYRIRYVFSAHYVVEAPPDVNLSPMTSALLVGDIDYGDAQIAAESYGNLAFSAEELQQTKESLETIFPDLRIAQLTAENVNRPRLLSQLSDFSHILLSTHGIWQARPEDNYGTAPLSISSQSKGIDPSRLSRAGLALSSINSTTGPEAIDCRLTAIDVSDLQLSETSLVTLSGCDTATGSILDGEGSLGLHRAFQIAGARTVIGTVFPVRDLDSLGIMTRFYFYLGRGEGKFGALHLAQLDSLYGRDLKGPVGAPISMDKPARFRESPHRWAAWVLFGEP